MKNCFQRNIVFIVYYLQKTIIIYDNYFWLKIQKQPEKMNWKYIKMYFRLNKPVYIVIRIFSPACCIWFKSMFVDLLVNSFNMYLYNSGFVFFIQSHTMCSTFHTHVCPEAWSAPDISTTHVCKLYCTCIRMFIKILKKA